MIVRDFRIPSILVCQITRASTELSQATKVLDPASSVHETLRIAPVKFEDDNCSANHLFLKILK